MTVCYSNAQVLTWEPDSAKEMLVPVGLCAWEDLKQGDFFAEMQEFYDKYKPKSDIIGQIASSLTTLQNDQKAIDFVIYFGAWCGDSKEHLPAFIKICDILQEEYQWLLPYSLIACNREKYHGFENYGEDKLFDKKVELVPTFVVFEVQNSSIYTEIGTIIETPQNSIEEDILQILQNNNTKD
jgi:thiol-disulfide isomerase/thioredoxin